ncbi:type II toxin-antitoxin system VapC family toxin [Variovorax sp. J22P271]|uniref:type II toxin-antitoxin system VapC family toxin n=1 Tax=Variovorax davisae TaxID=3053515 RepID=UPI002578923E|nr:type II toxin-antitoxin system VapC family toxin [Variovorax sp. J22P271]MDM0032199.1 type II toxin-antitoxin system VapC family toxin [Variovorax sp. J22P271]
MYVLDTNVVSELRPGKPHQSQVVRAWAAGIPDGQFFISAVTILELEMGILPLERRTPPEGRALRAWFDAMRKAFEGRVLPFTSDIAMRCAAMQVPDRKAFRDSMIAATTLEHGFTLATRNVRDFEGAGVKLMNPWEPR